MKEIMEILKDFGLEVPTEKQEDLKKAVLENYRTVAEIQKKETRITALEDEKKTLKEQLDSANETINSFEDEDVEGLKTKVAEWKEKAEKAEREYKAEIEARDFASALEETLKDVKFTSEYAKKSVMDEIKTAGLKFIDGKIIGLNDMLETIKAKDKAAFVDEEQQNLENNKARFTNPLNIPKGTKLTTKELMKLKNQYPEMDIAQYM